ncbi:MAG: ABC transporter ATP-binding protein [Candidatus Lokiarchaeota archaeon]|nr:ABC transporter ATP-binding protein [Candidatus Lokiarchaeota archaeon]
MWVGLEAEEYDRTYSDRLLLKRIASYFAPYKRLMLVVIFFLTISSLTTAFQPIIVSLIITNLETAPDFFYVIFLIVIIFFFNISGWVFNYIRQIYSTRVVGNVVLDIRKAAHQSVVNHDLSFFDRNPIGKVVSRINSDSRDFGETVELAIEVISSVVVLILLTIVMFTVDVILTLVLLISFPLFLIAALYFRKFARKMTLLGQRALASVNAFTKETFSGIQIAKTFRREKNVYENFLQVNNQSYRVNLRRAFLLNAIFPTLGLIQGFVTTLLIFIGSNAVIEGIVGVGQLVLFIQSLNLLFFPLLVIASFWPMFQTGMAASERIFAIIDTLPLVVQSNNIKSPKLKGEIEFKNLTFQYDKNKLIFDNFSLKVNPGESIALVGHTGAGKSSIAKLIARFYEFQGGDILVDGKSIRDYDLTEYRKHIGIIPQTPFLWADTVINNIKYGRESATKEEVLNALDISGGSEWTESLPDGLKTNVRERGSLLSMGQRQLVVFARVLLENPSILILDEATASVDPFTETQIQDALEKTIEGRSSIIIAHRLWTVRKVDRIIVLDHGKIVEEGNHKELMKRGGTYADLYNTYFRHQSLEYIENMGKKKV